MFVYPGVYVGGAHGSQDLAQQFDSTLGLFLKRFYSFVFEREGKGGGRRGRETSVCGCLLCATYWRPGLQPRHVP